MVYFLGASVGVLLLLLFGLRPMHASIGRLDEEIALIKARLAQQKELAPLYNELGKQVMREDSNILPTTEKAKLSVDQVGGISLQFQKIARECNLEAISVTPDAKSLTRDRKFMPVNLTLKGDFLRLRKFLFGIERLPYLEHTEEIQIQETSEGKEFRVKTWLAVDTQKSR